MMMKIFKKEKQQTKNTKKERNFKRKSQDKDKQSKQRNVACALICFLPCSSLLFCAHTALHCIFFLKQSPGVHFVIAKYSA